MQYLSILVTDKDYFYLVLIDKDYNEEKDIVGELQKNSQNSEWQMLEYHKITFKAIEKLALLNAATFDIEDRQLQDEARNLWRSYKEKWFKEYTNNRALQGLHGYQKEAKRAELQKTELVKIIDFVQRVIAKLSDCKNYNFHFKSPNEYQTLEEFADEIDACGYASKWVSLNEEALFAKEKEQGGNVLVFKLHNKDFRKSKQSLSNERDESERKENLFTRYWRDAMMLGREVRITPEIDIFKRKKEESGSTTRTLTNKEVVNKARNYHDKLYGAFGVEFYPAKKSDFDTVNKRVMFDESVHYLGLDRGENSLVSWCLVDSKGKLIKNGDWTIFMGVNYAEKLNFTKDEHGKKEESGFHKARIVLLEKYQKVSDCNNEEEKRILLEEAEKQEKEFAIDGLLAAEQIKKGYCGYLINEINKILKDYPHTYIVLEDLDIKGKVKEDEDITNKIQNLEKTLGGTMYQAVENAIVNKFKYYTVKDKSEYKGLQLVPNIVKVEDLRVSATRENAQSGKVNWVKSKEKIGNILFVDECLTSQMCPKCGFCICGEAKAERLPKFACPLFHEDIKGASLGFKNEGGQDVLMLKARDKTFTIRHLHAVKQTELDKIKKLENTNSKIQSLLVLRLKSEMKKGLYNWESVKKDPLFCSACGFNTEESEKFGLPTIKSGDDAAAYNIAKIGLEVYQAMTLKKP
ncbi:MAG: hypothetical protein AAB916_02860 [Patescibacteria group bacterium]